MKKIWATKNEFVFEEKGTSIVVVPGMSSKKRVREGSIIHLTTTTHNRWKLPDK